MNNINVPTYKITKHLAQILNKHLTLNNHIVSNSTSLANDLINHRLNKNHKLITYDIKDLLVNIPIRSNPVYHKISTRAKK